MREQMTHAAALLLGALDRARQQAPPGLPALNLERAFARAAGEFLDSGGNKVPTASDLIVAAGRMASAPQPESDWDDPDQPRSKPVATLGPTRASGRTRDVFDQHLYQDALAVRAMCFNGAQDPPFRDEREALHWLEEQCAADALLAAFRDWRPDGTTGELKHPFHTVLAKWKGRQTSDVILLPVGALAWHVLQPLGSLVREARRLRRHDDGRLLPFVLLGWEPPPSKPMPWVEVTEYGPAGRVCVTGPPPPVGGHPEIPGSYFRQCGLLMFAKPTVRDWLALHKKLFGEAPITRRKAMRQHAKPLRDRGWDWQKVTDAWNEKFSETLTRNAAMTLYRHGRRRRKGRD